MTLRNHQVGPIGSSSIESIGDLACGRPHRCGERRQRRCGADGQTAGREVADAGGVHLLRPPKNSMGHMGMFCGDFANDEMVIWNWDVEATTKDVVFFLDDGDFMFGLFGFLLKILENQAYSFR